MLIKSLNAGDFLKLANGGIYQVLCNDWWPDGILRDFICTDSKGNKKHLAFLDSDTKFENAMIVNGFEVDSLHEQIEKAIVYKDNFIKLCFKDRKPLWIHEVEYSSSPID